MESKWTGRSRADIYDFDATDEVAIIRCNLSGVKRGDDERRVARGVRVGEGEGDGGEYGLADTSGVIGGVVLGEVPVG